MAIKPSQVLKLAKLLEKSIKKISGSRASIAFSGGLDSTTLAAVSKKFYQPILITLSAAKNSEDLLYSKKAAKELSLPLKTITINEKKILSVYPKIWKLMPGTLVDMEIMLSVYFICKKAKELNQKAIVFGSGAEELFVGYNKYFVALKEGKNLKKLLELELKTLPKRDILRIKKVAKLFNLKTYFPFLEKAFVKEVKKIPLKQHISQELSKPVLRQIAEFYTVPSLVLTRKKRALQYGSNIHKLCLKLAKENKIYALEPRPPFTY
ncbi:MAG: asparagine synthase C-terminal domain-containing protein [Candidatus Micrarchaeota archaeon]|nr:asparagine synthase C-terminal domain-containing protein [Candidatus Micrarchaeota archaeon]